jgi:hypothetical protein
MGKIERIQVAPEDREWLVKLVTDRNTPQKIVWRSQIVLFAGEARWRHVSIHTAIGTPPTGGEREHETLVKACGTRLGVSLSVRRRNPITYWQA